MKTFGIVAAIGLVGCFLMCAGTGMVWMATSNREVSLRNAVVAQQEANRASLDTMWKILKEQAGVTEQYKEAFRLIYPEIIKGRYNDKSLLAKFVTESNPNFDTSLYAKLMGSIQAERSRNLTAQKKLVDLHREHQNTLDTFPGSLILTGRKPVEITVVVSDDTDEAFKTGKDNRTLNSK